MKSKNNDVSSFENVNIKKILIVEGEARFDQGLTLPSPKKGRDATNKEWVEALVGTATYESLKINNGYTNLDSDGKSSIAPRFGNWILNVLPTEGTENVWHSYNEETQILAVYFRSSCGSALPFANKRIRILYLSNEMRSGEIIEEEKKEGGE